jgi:hypothetical protein
MSLIINGKKVDVPGLEVHSWLDGPSWIKEITDFSHRSKSIRLIICHTHKGIKGNLLPGSGPGSSVASALVRYQTNTDRSVSWDYTIDNNGVVYCQNDPTKKVSWQAGSVNAVSLGFELVQNDNGDVYEVQIEKAVLLIDALTALLGIQRQIAWDRSGNKPKVTVCPRLESGGSDVVGIAGHRNQTKNRGAGDPGDHIYLALQKAGYECFDLNDGEDLKAWKERQKALGFPDAECDGIPGPKTVAALKAAGKKHGMWVSRPIDALLQP